MSSPVYSVKLADNAGVVGGPVTLFTVPAGRVYILRDVDVAQPAGIASALVLITGGTGAWVYYVASAVSPFYAPWRGRQVFVAGDTLKAIVIGSTTWTVLASGYDLEAA